MNIRKALLTTLLVVPAVAFAAGAKAKAPSANHFFVGANLGSGLSVGEFSAFYDANDTEARFENTAANTGMLAGLSLGYDMKMGASNNLTVALDFNFNSAMIKQTMHIESNANQAIEPIDLTQSVSPKMQYNLMLSYGYTVTPAFSSHVNLGGSMLVANHKLHIKDTGANSNGDDAANDSSGDTSVAGGVLGFGVTHKWSANTSVSFDANYFMYGTAKFDNLQDIVTGTTNTDSFSQRKFVLNMPAFTLSYHYGF